jgi:hypothetical protein
MGQLDFDLYSPHHGVAHVVHEGDVRVRLVRLDVAVQVEFERKL